MSFELEPIETALVYPFRHEGTKQVTKTQLAHLAADAAIALTYLERLDYYAPEFAAHRMDLLGVRACLRMIRSRAAYTLSDEYELEVEG